MISLTCRRTADSVFFNTLKAVTQGIIENLKIFIVS